MMTLRQYEELKAGQILMNDDTAFELTSEHYAGGWYGFYLEYDDEAEDYKRDGREVLLTMNEIRKLG